MVKGGNQVLMPAGKRRKALAFSLQEKIMALFGERIVPFDLAAAKVYAKIVVLARRRRLDGEHTVIAGKAGQRTDRSRRRPLAASRKAISPCSEQVQNSRQPRAE